MLQAKTGEVEEKGAFIPGSLGKKFEISIEHSIPGEGTRAALPLIDFEKQPKQKRFSQHQSEISISVLDIGVIESGLEALE